MIYSITKKHELGEVKGLTSRYIAVKRSKMQACLSTLTFVRWPWTWVPPMAFSHQGHGVSKWKETTLVFLVAEMCPAGPALNLQVPLRQATQIHEQLVGWWKMLAQQGENIAPGPGQLGSVRPGQSLSAAPVPRQMLLRTQVTWYFPEKGGIES